MKEKTFTFEEIMELLMGRHSTTLGGDAKWYDWDAIYSDLLDEGYKPADASIMLDSYMEKHGIL